MIHDHQPRDHPVLALGSRADEHDLQKLGAHIDAAMSDGHDALVIDLSATSGMGNQTLGQLCGLLRGVSGQGTTVTVSGADPRVSWILGLCEIPVLGPDSDADKRLVGQ